MAEVSYALREDSSSIYLLEDAGRRYENYCQVTVFGRNLVRPEFFSQYLYFAPYAGHNGKYSGTVTKIQMSLEDNERVPKYDYVAVIDSEVEFRITPSVLWRLSRDYMPAWGMKSYLDYFEDQKSGILLFLRVFKVNQAVDPSYFKKSSKGSSQILKLYDFYENEVSLYVNGIVPVVPSIKYTYLKDEILHLLKIENAFIAQYDCTFKGLQSLKERIEADRLVRGTHQSWYSGHMQRAYGGDDVDENFDMAQLDYGTIYQEVLKICPGMKSVVNYVRSIQAARIGEYDYLLKDVHERNENAHASALRIFDMSIRSAVKNAFYSYMKHGLDIEDSFQAACKGIIMAINKHSESVEGLFPSYASMWMTQIMGRELPLYQYNFRLPVHYKDSLAQTIRDIEDKTGNIDLREMDFGDIYRLWLDHKDCAREKAYQIASILTPAESIENLLEDPQKEVLLIDDNGSNYVAERLEEMEPIRDSLKILTEREKDVIVHRFGFDGHPESSLEEVGRMHGITRERIRQIELKAEWKILSYLLRVNYLTKAQYDRLLDTRFNPGFDRRSVKTVKTTPETRSYQ